MGHNLLQLNAVERSEIAFEVLLPTGADYFNLI